jgi:hypothetical protein
MRAHGSEPPCSKVKIYIQNTNTIYHFNVIVYSKQKKPDSSTIHACIVKVELHKQQNCCNLQQNLISTHVK